MSDLEELLGRAWRAREDVERAAVAGGDDPLAGLVPRVHRRRVRRRVVQGVVAVPVVAGLALGAWALAGRVPAPAPVVTQTQTPGPTPSGSAPAPTPDPTATSLPALPDPMTTTLGLPVLEPMPAGLLATAGPGWVLGVYQPAGMENGHVGRPMSIVVVLAQPGGPVYEVTRIDPWADLPADSLPDEWREITLVDWVPGTSTALVGVSFSGDLNGDGSLYLQLDDLDLTTGALTRSSHDLGLPAHSGGPMLLGVAKHRPIWFDRSGGARLIVDGVEIPVPEDASRGVVGPDERYYLDGTGWVVDLDAHAAVGGALPRVDGESCAPVGWWSSTQVLAACADRDVTLGVSPDAHPRLEVFDVGALAPGAGTVLRALGADDPWPGGLGAGVTDGRVAFDATLTVSGAPARPGSCSGQFLVTGDGIESIPSTDPRSPSGGWGRMASAAGWVAVETWDVCVDASGGPPVLGAARLEADGSWFSAPVLGAPVGGDPPSGGAWVAGPTSWVMGR